MTKRDYQLVLSLARGSSCTEASIASGLSVRTISRRMADAGFRQQVEQARRELLAASVGRLIEAAGVAIDVLKGLAENAESETCRCSAARSLVSDVLPLIQHVEMEERLIALEERFDGRIQSTTGTNGKAVRRGTVV